MEGLYRLPQIDDYLELNELASLSHKFSHLQWDIKAYEVDTIDDKKHVIEVLISSY